MTFQSIYLASAFVIWASYSYQVVWLYKQGYSEATPILNLLAIVLVMIIPIVNIWFAIKFLVLLWFLIMHEDMALETIENNKHYNKIR